MSSLRRFALVGLAALALASASFAQIPSELRVRHRSGQTFVTWREIPATGKRYRVYRSATPLVQAADLKTAEFLGEVDDRSSRNQGRSLATGVETTWIIEPGGAPLDADQGLFVHTLPAGRRKAYYAVTSVQAGGENRTLLAGSNATINGLFERIGAPEPVLQAESSEGQTWGHWVGDHDTPFQPALSPWPSRGFNFQYLPGEDPGPRGLLVRLHAAGQTYAQPWPGRFEVQEDVDILSFSDLMPYTSWSFWFGAQENLPSAPTPETRVWNFTQQRILWTLDWLSARLGAALDPERVYLAGGSMGAIGGMYLLNEYPERFAAALLRNGLYDLTAGDYRNPDTFEDLFGRFSLGLLTRDGLPILQRTNAAFMANLDPREDWPVLRTINGRNDETVGWSSAVQLYEGLARAGRPAVHYFDQRTHTPNGYWKSLERALLTRTFQTRRDRPSLRFFDCSLDDEAGGGARDDGDPIGMLNGALDYDARTASASAEALEFEVYLRAAGTLDDAPAASGWAGLGPRRTGPFALAPGEPVLYSLQAGAARVDEHLLFADAHGHVRTPPVPLELAHRLARFERGAPAAPRPLFVGAAPIAGDRLQVVLRGTPGTAWTLLLGAGTSSGPGSALYRRHGRFDARGLADLWLPLPAFLPAGKWLWARALIDAHFTAPAWVQVQGWNGEAPRGPRLR